MELVIVNARIWTPNRPHEYAQALCVRDGRFEMIGSNEEIGKKAAATSEVIDAQGRLVVPGFNDAHAHFMEGGYSLREVDLRDATDEQDFVQRLKSYAGTLPEGAWITGGYWDHERWPSKKLPTKELVDAAVAEHPVYVVRLDWHIGVANSLALRLAHITEETPDPPGGKIDRDENSGEPTGILRDEAYQLIKAAMPPPDREHQRMAARLATHHAAQMGVTSVQGECAADDMAVLADMALNGELKTRLSLWHPVQKYQDIDELASSDLRNTEFFRTGTAKLFADGSFGADTALLFEPYNHSPGNKGLMIHPADELARLVQRLDELGIQMAIHAIGDRAVRMVLDALHSFATTNGSNKLRHRFEHAQMVRDEDLPLFCQTGAVASVQPAHCIDDMRWIGKKLGARTHRTYRLNSFLQNGIPVAIGTDWTVEPLDPMLTLYAAVTRELPQGGPAGGWHPQERISAKKAVGLYTYGSAFAEHMEHQKGLIEPGFLADFVILSKNIFEIPPHEILSTQVDCTVVAGKIVYRASGF